MAKPAVAGSAPLPVEALAAAVATTASHEHTQMSRLIDAMLPPLQTIPGPGAALQGRRNAEARVALATEFGLLTAPEVAAASGSTATNLSATATRWRRQRRIFSVTYRGAQTYPGYQFDADGHPRPVIADVLSTLGDGVTGWELALWFVSSDGWLDGSRPVDLLEAVPHAVVEAAAHLVAGPPV